MLITEPGLTWTLAERLIAPEPPLVSGNELAVAA